MRPFSKRTCNQQIEFAPATKTTGPSGGVSTAYPEPGTGPLLDASVQPETLQRVDEDGAVYTVTAYNVFLREDPSPLNGGRGVNERDAFRYRGQLLVAQGPAQPPGEGNATWLVVCLDQQ